MDTLTPFDRPADYPSRREYLKQISRLSVRGGSALIAAGMALSSLSAAESPLPAGDAQAKEPSSRRTSGENIRRPEKVPPAPSPSKPNNSSKMLGTPLPPAPKTNRDAPAPKWKGKVVIYPKRDNEKRPSLRTPGEAVTLPAHSPKRTEAPVITLGKSVRPPEREEEASSEKILHRKPGEAVRPPEREKEASPKKS